MSGVRVVLFNNTSQPMTHLEHTDGVFKVLPPQAIGALSTAEFEMIVSPAADNMTCKYAMENVAGVFEFAWKSSTLNPQVPDKYAVEIKASNDAIISLLVQEKDESVKEVKDESVKEEKANTANERVVVSPVSDMRSLRDHEERMNEGRSCEDKFNEDKIKEKVDEPKASSDGEAAKEVKENSENKRDSKRFSGTLPGLSSSVSELVLKVDKEVEKRDYIVMEILKSERTYVENLTTLLTTYLNALKAIPENTLPPSLVLSIFSNAGEILPVNKQLLHELEKKWETWSSTQTIGDVIFQMTPFLKTYKNYTARYSDSLNALRECEKNAKFQSIVYKCTIQCRFDLDALLIQPVQRIPRYNLLLADLLKNTDESHPDYRNLSKSIEEMRNVAQYINESIQMNENRKKVIEIHNSMEKLPADLNLVEPHRVFVLQGILTKVCRKAPKKFTFFLFSDVLLYADPALGDKYKCHHVFYLSKCRFIDKGVALSFEIVSEKKSFAVVTKDQEEKDLWLSKLEVQTKQLRTRRASLQAFPTSDFVNFEMTSSSEAPVWVPDDAAKTCLKCNEAFTIISRRHHCRVCGLLVCGKCSPKKIRIPSMDNKNVRVCTQCYGKQKLQQILETHQE